MSRDKSDTDQDTSATLSWWQQLALAIGGILGSGWIIGIPHTAALNAWGLVPWVLGGLAMALIAAVVIRLAQADPRPGGLARWPENSSGRVIGTVVQAGLFVVYAGNAPAGALTAVSVLSRACGAEHQQGAGEQFPALTVVSQSAEGPQRSLTVLGIVAALGLLLALFAVHYLARKVLIRLNVTLSLVKVLVLVVLVVVATSQAAQPLLFPPNPPDQMSGLPDALNVLTAGGIMFAFTGFQGPVDYNNKGKQRVGVAIYGALILSIVLYLLMQATAAGWWPDQPPRPPMPGSTEWTVALAGNLLSPLTNALLFITLARIVLTTSAENMKMEVAGLDLRKNVHASIAVFAFGLLCLLLGLLNWTAISGVKSVIYVFVYSFAAVSYSAYWRAGTLNGHKRLRVLAPLSFAVATLLAYYAGLPALLCGCLLVAVVAIPMFLAKRSNLDHNRAAHWKRARWFFGYLGTLLVLSGFRYALWVAEDGRNSWYEQLLGHGGPQPFTGSPVYLIATHELAAIAAVAGLVFYRLGTRESEDLLRGRQRQDQAKHPLSV